MAGQPVDRDIDLDKIRIDGGTQSRVKISNEKVEEYAELLREGGEKFFWRERPVLFFDSAEYWLADGLHRYHASVRVGRKKLACKIYPGTQREAILFSCGANGSHGLPRTNADKRKAVETLLKDAEWSQWSNQEIARRAKVSHTFVNAVRDELASGNVSGSAAGDKPAETRKFTRGGKEAAMRVTKAPPAAKPSEELQQPGAASQTETSGAAATESATGNAASTESQSELPELTDEGPRQGKGEPRDINGTVIPNKLRRVFLDTADHFGQALRGLGAIQDGLVNASRIMPRGTINAKRVDEICRELNSIIEKSKPLCVCQKCEGKGGQCKPCNGRGYRTAK